LKSCGFEPYYPCFFSSKFHAAISGIPKEWLTDMEISYTEGPMNLNWKQIMQTVEGDDRFYMDTEEDEVTPKEAGWEFLRMHGKDDDVDEESEEESVYSENSKQDESVSLAFFLFLLMSNLIKPSLLVFSLTTVGRGV
jgi:hypothetical protein